MDVPPTFKQMDDGELVEELIHTTEHLQNCRIEGQTDTKQQNIQNILQQEILNRMESE
jgi:hypothetical protein